jgi:hypothetical protein
MDVVSERCIREALNLSANFEFEWRCCTCQVYVDSTRYFLQLPFAEESVYFRMISPPRVQIPYVPPSAAVSAAVSPHAIN